MGLSSFKELAGHAHPPTRSVISDAEVLMAQCTAVGHLMIHDKR